jgi:hypothetical protein
MKLTNCNQFLPCLLACPELQTAHCSDNKGHFILTPNLFRCVTGKCCDVNIFSLLLLSAGLRIHPECLLQIIVDVNVSTAEVVYSL